LIEVKGMTAPSTYIASSMFIVHALANIRVSYNKAPVVVIGALMNMPPPAGGSSLRNAW
jgi:hypothetical protein